MGVADMNVAIYETNEIHLANGRVIEVPQQVVFATQGSLEAVRRWAFYMGFIGRDTDLAVIGV